MSKTRTDHTSIEDNELVKQFRATINAMVEYRKGNSTYESIIKVCNQLLILALANMRSSLPEYVNAIIRNFAHLVLFNLTHDSQYGSGLASGLNKLIALLPNYPQNRQRYPEFDKYYLTLLVSCVDHLVSIIADDRIKMNKEFSILKENAFLASLSRACMALDKFIDSRPGINDLLSQKAKQVRASLFYITGFAKLSNLQNNPSFAPFLNKQAQLRFCANMRIPLRQANSYADQHLWHILNLYPFLQFYTDKLYQSNTLTLAGIQTEFIDEFKSARMDEVLALLEQDLKTPAVTIQDFIIPELEYYPGLISPLLGVTFSLLNTINHYLIDPMKLILLQPEVELSSTAEWLPLHGTLQKLFAFKIYVSDCLISLSSNSLIQNVLSADNIELCVEPLKRNIAYLRSEYDKLTAMFERHKQECAAQGEELVALEEAERAAAQKQSAVDQKNVNAHPNETRKVTEPTVTFYHINLLETFHEAYKIISNKTFEHFDKTIKELLEQQPNASLPDKIIISLLCGEAYKHWQLKSHLTQKQRAQRKEHSQRYYQLCLSEIESALTAGETSVFNLEALKTIVQTFIVAPEPIAAPPPPEPEVQEVKPDPVPTHLSLPLPDHVKSVLDKLLLLKERYPLCRIFVTGGAVRDVILGRTPKDYDIVVGAPLSEVQTLLGDTGITRSILKPVFVITPDGHEPIEICSLTATTLATDLHTVLTLDWRNNTVLSTQSITFDPFVDAKRRDNSANSLYVEYPDMMLLDPYQGYEHLKQGKLCFIPESLESVQKNPVMILRAIRQMIEGIFKDSDENRLCIANQLQVFTSLPKDRLLIVFKEMQKIFKLPNFQMTCKLIYQFNLFATFYQLDKKTDKVYYNLIRYFLSQENLRGKDELIWLTIFHKRLESNDPLAKACIPADLKRAIQRIWSITKNIPNAQHPYQEAEKETALQFQKALHQVRQGKQARNKSGLFAEKTAAPPANPKAVAPSPSSPGP